ncbi:MltA-interacting protein precursor [Serratia fonticola]|uniref:MltA-interacting protein n=1 Tax=Serratia fonticola TaxID=47917 RepID=A0A4U9THC0_SERFO|nr:MltA-interacting protein precursor [Serratia fonticola]
MLLASRVNWNSSNQNQYYYGINGDESRRSTFNTYKPSDSWSPYVELTTNYNINANWNAFFTGRYLRLDSEVKDSPMVDKSYTGMLWDGCDLHLLSVRSIILVQ